MAVPKECNNWNDIPGPADINIQLWLEGYSNVEASYRRPRAIRTRSTPQVVRRRLGLELGHPTYRDFRLRSKNTLVSSD
jgi:hypothetical protein